MKNIAILSTSLANGGAERFVLNLRELLLELNFKVYVVLISDVVDFEINFDYISLDNSTTLKYNILKPMYLYRFLKQNSIDIVIDNRTISSFFKAFIYGSVLRKYQVIKMVHNYKINRYLFSSFLFNKLCFGGVDVLVGVSKEIEYKVKDLSLGNKVTTIYNSIPKMNENIVVNKENYILYYGRLEEKSKNISFIIRSYKKSKLPSLGIKLYILGDGPDLKMYKSLVNELVLVNDVLFLPKTDQPFAVVKNAMWTVMSSHYEGFPMTLVESLASGTPVVTTNFKSGPTEIVKNRFNGLIVVAEENHFIQALNLFAEDESLYNYCKKNTKDSVQHLLPQDIKKHWEQLILSL